ncbi:unnamed protein product [Bemisia tabaci]|uniref:Solute carrier organic anion transporter family member n=1 Tax=Bemisia tabaci TaxID=7038 RepID=A0A9P0F1Y0_BEMTA|nr:unnamed protein product [Bemisia tabaci]
MAQGAGTEETCKREENHELEHFIDKQRLESFEDFYGRFELTEDATCGFGCIKGEFLQKCANKKTFAILYGFFSCIFAASFLYFNATISTIEKRFKIPSRQTGMISSGNDICQFFASILISYYAGKGHRPRWLAVSSLMLALFCITNSLPYFIFGPGDDAKSVTKEYGSISSFNFSLDKDSTLCQSKIGECDREGSIWPQLILFGAQLIAGLSGSLYHTLGISYADDNVQKSKSPAFLCLSLFFRMLGPAVGFGLASFSLKIFVSPSLHPIIDEGSPRWLGAWWIGWLVLAAIHVVTACLLGLYPKHLPRALARKHYNKRRAYLHEKSSEHTRASFQDLVQTVKRLMVNPIQVLNNLSGVFYYMALLPYMMFLPKYLETVFTFTPSKTSKITGAVEMVFAGIGMVASGVVLSKFKPRARVIAGYNVGVGALSVVILLMFAFLGCSENEELLSSHFQESKYRGDLENECNADCHCSFVKYSPVCAPTLKQEFVSACHAGCRNVTTDPITHQIKKYTSCACIQDGKAQPDSISAVPEGGFNVFPGHCQVQCHYTLVIFLVGMCLLKFANTSGRLPNLLLTMRSVDEKDKPVAMGFGLTIYSLFAFIPAPILVGNILDNTCLVWGKTCLGKGNCWLYDLKTMRYTINITAAAFMAIGTLLDVGVWYFSKNLKMFDDEPKKILRNSIG